MWSVQTWPATGQAPQSLARWQPSPIWPQYWPPGGVHETGVQSASTGGVTLMSIDGFESTTPGASTPVATSTAPPSLPPPPGLVGFTPAEQAPNSAAARPQAMP